MSRESSGFANEKETLADRVVTLVAGSSTNLVPSIHANRVLLMSTAAAAYTAVLPHATGSGDIYHFLLTIAHTSGSIVIKPVHSPSSNAIVGNIFAHHSSGNILVRFASTANAIITLNNTTQGALAASDYIKLIDTAAGVWTVLDSRVTSSGAQATPFSG